jgi:hypothetical protein
MRNLFVSHSPLPGLGMTSLVLGTIGLIIVLLPVLGIPISALGLLFGITGFVVALFTPASSLRWSVAGIAMSALALGANLAIAYAPGGYLSERDVPRSWQSVPDRPYVPPPAHPTQGPV